jgi:ribulose-5-phosphate 4-epimerase/fuculose-1-phosphate aldolase
MPQSIAQHEPPAVLHTHSPYATALCLIDYAKVEPIFLPGLQFFGRIAYLEECQGGAFDAEQGSRETAILGSNNVLMMRNHGPIVVGLTVAVAFDRLYYLEETCQWQILAMSSNQPLRQVDAAVAKDLADRVSLFEELAAEHFSAIKRVLDREEPAYAN